MSKVRFALIGCGRIGQRHAQHIESKGQLVAVCDIDPEKAQATARQFKAKSYENIDNLLADNKKAIDVVAICTPNGLHAVYSIAFCGTLKKQKEF